MAENVGAQILRDTDLEQRLLEAVIGDRNDQPRSKQLQVGPSEVGGCRELLRAGIFEAPEEAEPETNWAAAAHVGQVMGADLERIFGERLGAVEQQQIVALFGMLGLQIAGSADLIFVDDDQISDLKSNADIGGLLVDLKRDASAIETLLSIASEGLLFQKNIETADGGYELTQVVLEKISKLHYYVQISIYVMGAMQQGLLTADGSGRLVFYDRSGGYQGFVAVIVPPEQISLFYTIGQMRAMQVMQAQQAYEATGGNPAVIATLRDKAPSYCFSPKVMCPRRMHCWAGSDWTANNQITDPEHISAMKRYDTGRELAKLADAMKRTARDELKEAGVTGMAPDGMMLTWANNGAINVVKTAVAQPQPQAVLDQFMPEIQVIQEIEQERAFAQARLHSASIVAESEGLGSISLGSEPGRQAIDSVVTELGEDALAEALLGAPAGPRMSREDRYKALAKTGAPIVRRMANELTGIELKGLRKDDAIDAILRHEYPENVATSGEVAATTVEAAEPVAGEHAASTDSAFIAMAQPELDAAAAAQHALIEEAMQGGPAGDEASDLLQAERTYETGGLARAIDSDAPDWDAVRPEEEVEPKPTRNEVEAEAASVDRSDHEAVQAYNRRAVAVGATMLTSDQERARIEGRTEEQEEARRKMMRGEYMTPPPPPAPEPDRVRFVDSDFVPLENEDPQRPGLFLFHMPSKDTLRQHNYDHDQEWREKLISQREAYTSRPAQQ